jgi:hypothetical protein
MAEKKVKVTVRVSDRVSKAFGMRAVRLGMSHSQFFETLIKANAKEELKFIEADVPHGAAPPKAAKKKE